MEINIRTTRNVTPKIYAYTLPGVSYKVGWIKIGYTERDVDTRISEQLGTAGIVHNLEWTGDAIFAKEPRIFFSDRDFHAYLLKLDVPKQKEWFKISGEESKKYFSDFKQNHGVVEQKTLPTPYTLRDEQEKAVENTLKYFHEHENAEFLWNAKPRFGKTPAVYELCKRLDVSSVLIVTNRPAIANAWYDDYEKFLIGGEWLFVSEVDALKNKTFVLSRDDFLRETMQRGGLKCIEFVSLQDLKGSTFFGGEFNKLQEVAEMNWDLLVVDEAHEGVDTLRTDIAFDKIARKNTLHLSGTPFKALANNKFPQEAIFNWTYADEQRKKSSWSDNEQENPYADLPRLNLYTYQMSEIVRDKLKRGIDIDGEEFDYAFDLNEFFATKDEKTFIHDEAVDKFLDALTSQKKFPFSTPELRDKLRHTFWLLNRVDSARALAKKLQQHKIFRDYKIILAAGDGKLDDDTATKKSYDEVVKAIKNFDKTITLSVGQLTTGVTIPEWTGVLMLANMHSPALYVQAAFRAQNPCLFQRGENFLRKENSYVFDFDPARTLMIFERFANDLAEETSGGRGSVDVRKENIRELLNFFPVIGEDEQGELIELDSEKVLSIPRRIRSVEVVRRGFMCDFLFQNIAHVFHATSEKTLDIIHKFPAIHEVDLLAEVQDAAETILLDENDEISIPREHIIGQAADIFGEKVFATLETSETAKPTKKVAEKILKHVTEEIVETVQEHYGDDLNASDGKKITKQLKDEANNLIAKTFAAHDINLKVNEQNRAEMLKNPGERSAEEIKAEFDSKRRQIEENFRAELPKKLETFIESAKETAVEHAERTIQEREKNSVEDEIRDHLRGFSRTIPAFLMAYGDENVTLANFDKIIPDKDFRELTSVSLDDFRHLRDVAQLFDAVTFDDAVKEFMRLRRELANYLDESHTEDIFDYIPPQRTNQIFTPRETVENMLKQMETENFGCFDSPNETFIDLYMKSGMFAAALVKKLYRNPNLQKIFPDRAERLRHIFAKQVFGLAPTEIIYRIATNYILGVDVEIVKHNFRQADALPAVKADKIDEFLEKIYG